MPRDKLTDVPVLQLEIAPIVIQRSAQPTEEAVYTGDPLELARRMEAVAERAGSPRDATDAFADWLRREVESAWGRSAPEAVV